MTVARFSLLGDLWATGRAACPTDDDWAGMPKPLSEKERDEVIRGWEPGGSPPHVPDRPDNGLAYGRMHPLGAEHEIVVRYEATVRDRERQRDEARERTNAMHRRAQEAEAALVHLTNRNPDATTGGPSFGRGLLQAALTAEKATTADLRRQRDEALERVRELEGLVQECQDHMCDGGDHDRAQRHDGMMAKINTALESRRTLIDKETPS